MVYALHQLEKIKRKKKQALILKKNNLFSFATFTVNLVVTEQNKT